MVQTWALWQGTVWMQISYIMLFAWKFADAAPLSPAPCAPAQAVFNLREVGGVL